jgi:hypothetical protein
LLPFGFGARPGGCSGALTSPWLGPAGTNGPVGTGDRPRGFLKLASACRSPCDKLVFAGQNSVSLLKPPSKMGHIGESPAVAGIPAESCVRRYSCRRRHARNQICREHARHSSKTRSSCSLPLPSKSRLKAPKQPIRVSNHAIQSDLQSEGVVVFQRSTIV